MDFYNKLKLRLGLAIGYIVLGLALIVVGLVTKTDNQFVSAWGLALTVVGVVRVRNHCIITKSEESVQRQRIAESDERNIAISEKAKSVAFIVYILTGCVVVLILQLLDFDKVASLLALSVCILLVIYRIAYIVIRKRM